MNVVFLILIAGGLFFCFLRLLKGPTVSDRALAIDTSSTVTTALLAFLALYFKRYLYLDVALVYALLTFVGTLVFARYLEKGI